MHNTLLSSFFSSTCFPLTVGYLLGSPPKAETCRSVDQQNEAFCKTLVYNVTYLSYFYEKFKTLYLKYTF
jgi:hypothetical protein